MYSIFASDFLIDKCKIAQFLMEIVLNDSATMRKPLMYQPQYWHVQHSVQVMAINGRLFGLDSVSTPQVGITATDWYYNAHMRDLQHKVEDLFRSGSTN